MDSLTANLQRTAATRAEALAGIAWLHSKHAELDTPLARASVPEAVSASLSVSASASRVCLHVCRSGKLASFNRSWQSDKCTFRASGMAGIEPMLSESE